MEKRHAELVSRRKKLRTKRASTVHAPKLDEKRILAWWRKERTLEDGHDPLCTCECCS